MSYSLTSALSAGITRPETCAARLLKLPEFSHLRDGEAHIEFIMRGHPQVRAGRQILGTCHLPQVQGKLKDVFLWILAEKFGTLPDFLIELDAEWWIESGERDREVLVYHELSHAEQAKDKNGEPRFNEEGRPVFSIKGHDIEEFSQVVLRYGAHSPDLKAFFAALNKHQEATR